MCNNGSSIVRKLPVDDIISLRKSIAKLTIEECEKFDLQIPRKYFLRGSVNRLKSRSDSDIFLSDDYKNLAKYAEFEVSSFPSDSDITVIRVLKRSRVQGTPSRGLEGILGDGSHLPESPSMVNLATLVQGIPTSGTEERLIALSSWDSPINHTASDTTIQSAFSQLQEDNFSNFVNDRFFPRHIVAGLSELVTNDRNSLGSFKNWRKIKSSIIIDADLNEEISIGGNKLVTEKINNHNDVIEFNKDKTPTTKNCRREKLFVRFFARIQKTLRRAMQCSCFPAVDRRDE